MDNLSIINYLSKIYKQKNISNEEFLTSLNSFGESEEEISNLVSYIEESFKKKDVDYKLDYLRDYLFEYMNFDGFKKFKPIFLQYISEIIKLDRVELKEELEVVFPEDADPFECLGATGIFFSQRIDNLKLNEVDKVFDISYNRYKSQLTQILKPYIDPDYRSHITTLIDYILGVTSHKEIIDKTSDIYFNSCLAMIPKRLADEVIYNFRDEFLEILKVDIKDFKQKTFNQISRTSPEDLSEISKEDYKKILSKLKLFGLDITDVISSDGENWDFKNHYDDLPQIRQFSEADNAEYFRLYELWIASENIIGRDFKYIEEIFYSGEEFTTNLINMQHRVDKVNQRSDYIKNNKQIKYCTNSEEIELNKLIYQTASKEEILKLKEIDKLKNVKEFLYRDDWPEILSNRNFQNQEMILPILNHLLNIERDDYLLSKYKYDLEEAILKGHDVSKFVKCLFKVKLLSEQDIEAHFQNGEYNLAYGLAKNYDLNYIIDGKPLLVKAIEDHENEIAIDLIKSGADVNFCCTPGHTPLRQAVFESSENIVEALLVNNADIFIKDSIGDLPIHYIETPEIAKLFIDDSKYKIREQKKKYKRREIAETSGFNLQNEFGNLMHNLIKKDLPDVAKVIVKYTQFKDVNSDGYTVYDFAEKYERKEFIEIFDKFFEENTKIIKSSFVKDLVKDFKCKFNKVFSYVNENLPVAEINRIKGDQREMNKIKRDLMLDRPMEEVFGLNKISMMR